MSKQLEWRTCLHCRKDKYCTDLAMQEHVEDCDKRPAKLQVKVCPKCESVLEKILPASWICLNESCDYQLGVLTGGKE